MIEHPASDNGNAPAANAGRSVRALLGAVVFAGVSLLAANSYAFTATQCGFDRGATGCTANDTGIVSIALDPAFAGTDPTTCLPGTQITAHLILTVATTATARYNIGLLLANDGKDPTEDPATTGAQSCTVSVLPTTAPFSNLDANTCGDLTSAAGTVDINVGAVSLKCVAGPGGLLQIPGVAVWEQQEDTPGCTGPTDVHPGTSSKCKVSLSQTIPVTVVAPTGSVQLFKAVLPSSDPGLFNLSVASPTLTTATASNIGDGGNTTLNGIAAAALVTLGETAGTGTNLASYTSSLACVRTDTSASVPVVGSQITMPAGTPGVVCTFTNTRIGRTVNMFKAVSPGDDPGLFNLLVNGSPVATNQGDGGTGFVTGILPLGQVTVSETAGTGTSLANYTASLTCESGGQPIPAPGGVFTMPDADVNCTFTNRRTQAIPTLSEWGMIGMAALLAWLGAWTISRRRTHSGIGGRPA